MEGHGEELANEMGYCWENNSPARRCRSSSGDYIAILGCESPITSSPIKSTATCKSAPPALGSTSRRSAADEKTRRYNRSTEPRLKWNEELHLCFLRAIEQLGGPSKATPKAILQVMNVKDLKIAHVKSHLQMFRTPRSHKNSSPQSDFTFWSGKQPSAPPAADIPEQEESPEVWNYMSNAIENSSGKALSGEFSGSTELESLSQFNQMSQFSKESYPSIFKMVEVLESRATKSQDQFETPGDVDIDRLSHQLLAGDADAARLYDSAELLAHNLLMAMRERRLLETEQSHQHSHHHDDTIPEMPLELTMSIGVPDSNPDLRTEILTLDLTEQLNRPHL